MYTRHLLNLLVVFVTPAYALDAERALDLSGIWHSELDASGLQAALEFELQLAPDSGNWIGRWEMLERTGWGPLPRVQVDGASLEVDMNSRMSFTGQLFADEGSLVGTLSFSGEDFPMTFVKIEQWATLLPAQVDEQGLPAQSWRYQPPDLIEDGWPVEALNEQEIQDLHELFQNVIDDRYRGLDAVLVARQGRLVLEEYFHFGDRDEIHTLQSITKSVTSLLIGMAYDEGLITDLKQPVYTYFSDYADSTWVKGKYPISLEHVLTMSAGLDWREEGVPYTDPRNDAIRMNNSNDMIGYVLSRNESKGKQPGDEFAYTSGLSILLGGVVRDATGVRIDRYADQTLFKKMGIERYYWAVNSDQVHTGGGLYLRPRDLLKLGQLVLDQGRWNDQQVVSERWIDQSTAFQLPRPKAGDEAGYGYQWWHDLLYTARGSVPVIYGDGFGGQLLWVFPKLDLVMLVMHHNPRPEDSGHTMTLYEVQKFIIPALVADKLNGFCMFRICI